MNSLHDIVHHAQATQLFRPLDIQFAKLLSSQGDACHFLAAACLSAGAGEGHVCLPLEQLNPISLWAGKQREEAEQLWHFCAAPGDAASWAQALAGWSALHSTEQVGPICLIDQQLYLQRAWRDEQQVAHFFYQISAITTAQEPEIRQVLDHWFGKAPHNDQKVAAAVALTRQHSIISGGPGTGKTTTVAKLLAAMIQLSTSKLRIQMAAPTGKAAARLTESLGNALNTLEVTNEVRQHFPQEATTLHRLLGAQAYSQQLRYHAGNKLHLDLLIVDEASMVDLSMMAKLIAALPDKARVIFLGDRDQLASVEAGAVLGDICHCAELGYSPARAAQLTRLTGCQLTGQESERAPQLRDSLCLLRHSYRFGQDSGIGQLARAVNQGNTQQVSAILAADFTDIRFSPLTSNPSWQQMLADVCQGYAGFLVAIQQQQSARQILTAFSHFQLLCALRDGPFGVSGLNQSIEHALRQRRFIDAPATGSQWYLGRPIMITRNDSALGLFNGDIGITLLDEQQQLKVYFQLPEGDIRPVSTSRLPAHETVWAMTVHKSQGSEFTHTALVLPGQSSPVLSREMIYTAITRAKSQLTLYGEMSIFNRAIDSRTQRRSGLTAALQPKLN